MKTFSQFITETEQRIQGFNIKDTDTHNLQVSENKVMQDNESTRYEDDTYRTTKEKIANPRLKRLRILLNRELGRYTV